MSCTGRSCTFLIGERGICVHVEVGNKDGVCSHLSALVAGRWVNLMRWKPYLSTTITCHLCTHLFGCSILGLWYWNWGLFHGRDQKVQRCYCLLTVWCYAMIKYPEISVSISEKWEKKNAPHISGLFLKVFFFNVWKIVRLLAFSLL